MSEVVLNGGAFAVHHKSGQGFDHQSIFVVSALALPSLQAPGRCRGSSRVVLKAAPGIGDQRRVLLKPLRKPIFVVRSRNSRRSSVGAGSEGIVYKAVTMLQVA